MFRTFAKKSLLVASRILSIKMNTRESYKANDMYSSTKVVQTGNFTLKDNRYIHHLNCRLDLDCNPNELSNKQIQYLVNS